MNNEDCHVLMQMTMTMHRLTTRFIRAYGRTVKDEKVTSSTIIPVKP